MNTVFRVNDLVIPKIVLTMELSIANSGLDQCSKSRYDVNNMNVVRRGMSFIQEHTVQNSHTSLSNMRNIQKCEVCGGNTFHSFYGAVVCDPCRTFFRRQVINQGVRSFE